MDCTGRLKIYIDEWGSTRTVVCRKCESCRKARKREWLGRLLAEEHTADAVWFATFTYAGGYDNPDAYFLKYRDMQLTFKRWRKAGYRFRHLTVGEYGTERGRAHWHSMIFWYGKVPDLPLGVRLWHPEQPECPPGAPTQDLWPHGMAQFELPKSNRGCAVYILDYLEKGSTKEHLESPRMRCSTGMGLEYLEEYARRHAREGLGLFQAGPRYTLPNNNNRDGKPFYYTLDRYGALYPRMLEVYLLEWATLRSSQRLPLNEQLVEYLEDVVHELERQPQIVQDYIAEVYGYEPVTVPEEDAIEFTMVSADWGITRDTLGASTLYRFNKEGEIAWQATEAGVSGEDAEQIAKEMLRRRPPRVDRISRQDCWWQDEVIDLGVDPDPPPPQRSRRLSPSDRKKRSPSLTLRQDLSRRHDVGTNTNKHKQTTARIP